MTLCEKMAVDAWRSGLGLAYTSQPLATEKEGAVET
ncbi:hypothetical protein GGE07_005888 [Sinorhizobium terangae]|nr:hypothetical protein [Sinorhizobium terangae]